MPFISNLVISILAFHVSGCGDMCRVWSSYKTTKGKAHFRVIKTLHNSQSNEVIVCIYGLFTKRRQYGCIFAMLFCACLTEWRFINTPKKERGQYLAILTEIAYQ